MQDDSSSTGSSFLAPFCKDCRRLLASLLLEYLSMKEKRFSERFFFQFDDKTVSRRAFDYPGILKEKWPLFVFENWIIVIFTAMFLLGWCRWSRLRWRCRNAKALERMALQSFATSHAFDERATRCDRLTSAHIMTGCIWAARRVALTRRAIRDLQLQPRE